MKVKLLFVNSPAINIIDVDGIKINPEEGVVSLIKNNKECFGDLSDYSKIYVDEWLEFEQVVK